MKLSKSKLALAKVVNENGGWPSDEASFAAQDKIDGESSDNTISFYSGKVKPTRLANNSMWRCENSGSHFMGYEKTIRRCKLLANWHQTCLSREEYYQAYPKAGADGWIEWKGGECPVYGDNDVDVVLVDGSTDHGIADEFDWHRDGGPLSVASYRLRNADVGVWLNWNGGECPVGDGVLIDVKKVDGSVELAVHDPQDRIWGDTDHRKCIIAYRPHKPEVKPEFCESVTRSTPEYELDDAESRLAKALELVKASAPHLLSDKYKFNGDEVMGERKPAIDQLAHDHRNAKDYADRLQKEADDAAKVADVKLGELEQAMEQIGFSIKEIAGYPEMVIPCWRDWVRGDEVQCIKTPPGASRSIGLVGHVSKVFGECVEVEFKNHIAIAHGNLIGECFKFIRRP